MIDVLGKLLGIERLESIDSARVTLAARWAGEHAFWVFLLALALVAGAVLFYWHFQRQGSARRRFALGVVRGMVLLLLLLALADPVLQLKLVHEQRPLVYVVFDGTDSMSIADEYSSSEQAAMERAVGALRGAASSAKTSRIEYLQRLIRKPQENLLASLTNNRQTDVELFVFDGHTTSQLRKLGPADGSKRRLDPDYIAEQLKAKGQVTALGSVLEEIQQQFSSRRLAAVILFSDFDQNSGPSPVAGPQSPAARLRVPIYTVGLGATEAVDLAVDLRTDDKMKKAERSTIQVQVRQTGFDGRSATVRVTAKKLSGEEAAPTEETVIGQRLIALNAPVQTIVLPFTPEDSGRIEFTATADKLEGDAIAQNNQSTRQLNVIDDYLRLMYVAYEPTWEWRFVKEVFHRDKLVGMSGFRTFLSSSDPRVRESNTLFLPTLTPKRSDFFANDVLFIDDMPRSAISDRFCDLTKQFVSQLGGGLVVIAGPRFGPRELYQTPLADMLPVIIDPNAELRSAPDHPEFRPRLTPHAGRYSFMQLGADSAESGRAWDNLGKLPWYQPVSMPHPQAEVLLEHPTDKCADGKTPQPLIAIRPYGKGGAGEVVWIGFNEMWRLRRLYGEKYYRQFWSQLIYRLGMSHVLGAEKRFVVSLDQSQYRAEDKVTVSVEAYDEHYEPLSDEKLPEHGLAAELILPSPTGTRNEPLLVPMVRKGAFELQFPVTAVGSYSLRVKDPITGKLSEQRFDVTALSAERRRGVRDQQLQHDLAQVTGGKSYDLTTADRLPQDLKLQPITEHVTQNCTLWATPLWFGAVVLLMLGEWITRKIIRLS
ncbi:MAG: VWA domain-containing protein [Planctomycetia bacterium]|nr:VWA domain-containing protein [Planctomycetia bacterium]